MVALAAAALTGCATGATGDPTAVRGTAAHVDGLVVSDSGGEVEYWVEFGTTTAYGSETAHDTVTTQANQPVSVFRVMEGLQRATTYHYRFCARDSQQRGGPGCGEDRQLTTVNVDCGDEITADLRLSGDLNCQPVGLEEPSALVVAAPGIDIDLNGHLVAGGTGIDNGAGHDDVTIRDGQLEGLNTAVLLEGASRNRLLRLAIGRGIPGLPGPQTTDGVSIAGGEDNLIRASRIGGDGSGVVVDGSDRLVLVGSPLGSHFGGGLILAADFARILNNSLLGDFGEGLLIRGSGNRIRGNVVSGFAGVHVESGDGNVIAENQASGGARFPIEDTDDQMPGDGIHVAAAAAGTVVRANVANGSQGDGIEVLSPSTRLGDNTANDNALWGIDGVLGVLDLGGNSASGNGSGQCRFVAC